MESFVHLRKGRTPQRLHADLDGLKDDELGRGGFTGRTANIYRRHDPTAWAGAAPPVPPGPLSRSNGCASRSHSKITASTTAKPVEYQSYQGRRRRLRMNDLIAATRGGPAAVAVAITGPVPWSRVRSSARRRSA